MLALRNVAKNGQCPSCCALVLNQFEILCGDFNRLLA